MSYRYRELGGFSYSVLVLAVLFGCGVDQGDEKAAFTQSTKAEIVQMTPKKPTRIELKRTAKGTYSWKLSGEDVDDIQTIDRALRDYVKNGSRPDVK